MNPYSSPTSELEHRPTSQQQQFKQIVIAWEKLRLLYNVIMFFTGVIALFVIYNYYRESTDLVLFQALIFAIVANFCFFGGPVCELYLRAFRDISNAQSLRWILFTLGTIISTAPAVILTTSPVLY